MGTNDCRYRVKKGMGLVSNVFSEEDLHKLKGNIGIGKSCKNLYKLKGNIGIGKSC